MHLFGEVPSNCLGLQEQYIRKKIPPEKLGAEHGTYPPPKAGRKRHRALCGRLSGSGWESLAGKTITLSDDLCIGNAPRTNRALNPVDPWFQNTRRGWTPRLIAQRLKFVTKLPTDEVRRGIDIVIVARIHELQGQVPKQLVLLQEETFL